MKVMKKIYSIVLVSMIAVGGLAIHPAITNLAYAQTTSAKSITDHAKTQKIVGERIDGYLGLVTGNVSPEIQSAVNEINIRRKSLYTKLARDQGVEIAVIARLTGEKLIAKAMPGEQILGDDGVWRTK